MVVASILVLTRTAHQDLSKQPSGPTSVGSAAGRGRPPQAAARRAGLEFVEKLLTAKLTSADTTERMLACFASRSSHAGRAGAGRPLQGGCSCRGRWPGAVVPGVMHGPASDPTGLGDQSRVLLANLGGFGLGPREVVAELLLDVPEGFGEADAFALRVIRPAAATQKPPGRLRARRSARVSSAMRRPASPSTPTATCSGPRWTPSGTAWSWSGTRPWPAWDGPSADPRTTAWIEPQVDDLVLWRRLRGSNPRGSCPPTRFPGVCLRPLGQASAAQSSQPGGWRPPARRPRPGRADRRGGRARWVGRAPGP
jgi:hypothetical protein